MSCSSGSLPGWLCSPGPAPQQAAASEQMRPLSLAASSQHEDLGFCWAPCDVTPSPAGLLTLHWWGCGGFASPWTPFLLLPGFLNPNIWNGLDSRRASSGAIGVLALLRFKARSLGEEVLWAHTRHAHRVPPAGDELSPAPLMSGRHWAPGALPGLQRVCVSSLTWQCRCALELPPDASLRSVSRHGARARGCMGAQHAGVVPCCCRASRLGPCFSCCTVWTWASP